MGGLDLCYGRWDTSQHVLTDEDFSEPEGEKGPIWRGKDYANERVMEYADLDKPFVDMFDRSRVPRMPWHDVGLQLVGQPARDLCRHFIQRWNLLIRTKVSRLALGLFSPAESQAQNALPTPTSRVYSARTERAQTTGHLRSTDLQVRWTVVYVHVDED